MVSDNNLYATVLVSFSNGLPPSEDFGLSHGGFLLIPAAALFVQYLDTKRRRVSWRQAFHLPLLTVLDLLLPMLVAGLLTEIVLEGWLAGNARLIPTMLGLLLAFPLLWLEGRKQIQIQRPVGLVFAEGMVALGCLCFLNPAGEPLRVVATLMILAGVMITGLIVPPFYRKEEALRILDRVADAEQFPQPEYTASTPECPRPELWNMLDSQSTELEVLDFLKSMVVTIKPRLILETGTFLGHGTVKLAEGIRENGFGRVITVEADPAIRARAQKRFQEAGLGEWIESRLESSLETKVEGTIDFFYCDSHLANREAEIRRLLPQLNPRGVLVIHDASSHFKIVREAALRLEEEGLISVVMLPTPRGVVVAQRREGRK